MAASDVENGPTLVTNASDDEKSLVKSQRKWDSGDRVSQLEDVLFVDFFCGGWWRYSVYWGQFRSKFTQVYWILYTVQCKPG